MVPKKKKTVAKRTTTKKVAKPVKKIAKPAVKKTTTKAAKPKSARKPNPAFMKPWKISPSLAAVVGGTSMPRTEVISQMWVYIRKHNLQDKNNKRMINADEKLRPIFGRSQVSMFEMAKLISSHLS